MADALRIPEARVVVVPHPIGGTEEEVLQGWADRAVEPVIRLLG